MSRLLSILILVIFFTQNLYSSIIDTNRIYGLTIDNISGLAKIDTALARLCKKPTTRIVFDEFVAATYYQTAVNQIHNFSFIMGELLDSYYMNQYNLAQYVARTNEYVNLLGNKVDIWEVGNEANGEWLGAITDVVSKIDTAYKIVKSQGKKTELTLYYNKNCYSNAQNEMFRWVNQRLSTSMRNGLDYVLVSYYEDDCNGFQPNWQQVFDSLHVLFPNSKLGIGECGTLTAGNKASYINRYYKMNITTPNYIGGYFWWYFYQDCVPYTNSLWATFNNAIANYSAPTVQATQLMFSTLSPVSISLGWTNGNGSNRVVFMIDGNGNIPAVQDGMTYTANTNFGFGNTDGTGWFCIYNGSGLISGNITVTGLTQSHTYKIMALEYNGTSGFEGYNKNISANNPITVTGYLPVEMVSFTSIVDKNDVRLNWITNSEINNKEFQVERTICGEKESWFEIGFLYGKGNSNTQSSYEFKDNNLRTGKYKYRLKQIDYNGNFKFYNLSSEVKIDNPDKFELNQNYPNPFNPTTIIGYQIPNNNIVELLIYDVLGRKVETLVNEKQSAGTYEVKWSGMQYPNGVYFYRLNAGDFSEKKKMLLIK